MTRARIALALVAATAGLLGWAMAWTPASPAPIAQMRTQLVTDCAGAQQLRVRPVGMP